jgi:DNA replication protein DnaC
VSDPRVALLGNYLRELKMPGLKRAYQALAREALNDGKHPLDSLAACLAADTESRREYRLQARLHSARFPTVKTLDAFDFSQIPSLPKPKVLDLARGEFIRAKENVVCLGGSGTGKTHIAISIGLAAIEAGYRVRFIQTITLAQELLQAQQEYRLPKYLKSWHAVDLVIVDEFGYLGLGPGGPLLFQFFADRYERGSLLVTSNLEFSRWGEVFGDAKMPI